MSIYDPFKNIFQTNRHFFANIYKTTFAGKLYDTAQVFSGYVVQKYRHPNIRGDRWSHWGLFDYLTLGIHRAITLALIKYLESRSFSNAILKSRNLEIAALIGVIIVFSLPRYVFTALLTFVCIPFISIVHAFIFNKAQLLKKQINAFPIKTSEINIYLEESIPLNLELYKNSFVYSHETKQLFYVDFQGATTICPFIDFEGFQKRFQVTLSKLSLILGLHGLQFTTTRDELSKFINNFDSLSESYTTMGQLLATKGLSLEILKACEIEQNGNQIKLAMLDNKLDKLPALDLDLEQPADKKMLNLMAELNIAEIELEIEENAPYLLIM